MAGRDTRPRARPRFLVEHLAAEVESLGDDRANGRKLLRTLDRRRRTARRRLIAVLDSDRYFALLDALEQPVRTIADVPTLERSSAARAQASSRRPSGRSQTSRPTRSCMPVPNSGEARPLRGLSSGRCRLPMSRRRRRCRTVLGEHQDAVVAAEQLRDLARRMPDTALAAGKARRARARASAPGARRVAVA
jgi:CHAD domain-containing protein